MNVCKTNQGVIPIIIMVVAAGVSQHGNSNGGRTESGQEELSMGG